MARLLFVDAMGAGRVFNAETNALHDRFAGMIAGYLDEAIAEGAIPPIDTALTGVAWFGALNEVVARWLLTDDPAPLESGLPDAPRTPAPKRRGGRGPDRDQPEPVVVTVGRPSHRDPRRVVVRTRARGARCGRVVDRRGVDAGHA